MGKFNIILDATEEWTGKPSEETFQNEAQKDRKMENAKRAEDNRTHREDLAKFWLVS